MTIPQIARGVVFGVEHDSSYEFWVSGESRWKLCVAFNVKPPKLDEDVLYFICTSNAGFFREHPHFLSDVVLFPAKSYQFFPDETVLDLRTLATVPLKKLISKGLKVLGTLSAADIAKCEKAIQLARILENKSKWRVIPKP